MRAIAVVAVMLKILKKFGVDTVNLTDRWTDVHSYVKNYMHAIIHMVSTEEQTANMRTDERTVGRIYRFYTRQVAWRQTRQPLTQTQIGIGKFLIQVWQRFNCRIDFPTTCIVDFVSTLCDHLSSISCP